ncbi:uncharacterized protein Z518_03804 [Rhinocladiella mackenziei CBS 650.93]|uniref:Rhinocladiella mackenziei CBS 650.93 unplaced genomic scaffold supercont1.3, whole genome shotgun sequence n=1 Tax=Rhinocladiella mackenziei CBS 650.93 TaxID=1442369 RepID=A0A0D2IRR6_9EURO|nr:uncharacterized protein Z518_03804 [Rhinocladiella mackenziei CBS 650.93]KIX05831.1 hypothetical protein Z518_03804 [Rhinocladiella mackenziei CBS 650.93]
MGAPLEAQETLAKMPNPNSRRCRLHIRQQPRAARAGPDGKDRRAIDPPPILQLLMNDFDPDSPDDVAEIQSQFWIVHCRLVAGHAPDVDVSTVHHTTEDGKKEVQRLLLGTWVASPTTTQDDPDPQTMPSHPQTRPPTDPPPSPTTRFLPNPAEQGPGKAARHPYQIPGCFFIFADISVRRAGEYRLHFTLMKMDETFLEKGSLLPCIHQVTSEVFRVVNAKDFDQVQPSTNLVKGLLDRGAGFPLKLKKGTREGGRRRRQQSGENSDDDSRSEDNEY